MTPELFSDIVPDRGGWYIARLFHREGRNRWTTDEPVLLLGNGAVITRAGVIERAMLSPERIKWGPAVPSAKQLHEFWKEREQCQKVSRTTGAAKPR